MTLQIAAVFLTLLTAALLAEEVAWRRRQRRLAERRHVPPTRCLVCPGTPMVDDYRTHSRLVHRPRARGVEDSREWAS
jgi:hypothetical protein